MRGVSQRGDGHIFGVRGQRRPKPCASGVEVEERVARAVLTHRFIDFRDSGASPLRQAQLLQKLADSSIASRRGRHGALLRQVLLFDARNRAGIADYLYPVRVQVHLYWLRNTVVPPMVYRVHQRLAQCGYRPARPPLRAKRARLLLRVRAGDPLQIVEGSTQLLVNAAREDAFLDHVACRAPGELHHLDPSAAKPVVGVFGEHQKPYVFRGVIPVDLFGDTHPSEKLSCIRLFEQTASHILQKLAYLHLSYIFDGRRECAAVVERNTGRHLQQLMQKAISFGVHALRPDSDEVFMPPVSPGRSVMRAYIASRSPEDQNMLSVHDFGRHHRLIRGIDTVAVAPNPLLHRVDLLFGESFGRE